MYDRFTDRARKVMQLANDEAMHRNHKYIGSEHILLGLIKEGGGVAAVVLKNVGIDLHKIRVETERIAPSGSDSVPLSLHRSRSILDHSMEEARNLNHGYVGTEHLLLGVLREPEGAAVQVITLE
jgi:ATP-dependent Clp protease ATP-binding subunit ClpC